MEGECYAFIWGIMHFRQYFHQAFFLLRIDHKPFEWLAIVFEAYKRRGRWISMLQDFHFKIVHRASFKHANVDALNINPMDRYEVNEDFGNEIQDLTRITQDALKPSFRKDSETIINLFIVLTKEEEDHDVDHYKRGEKVIAFKAETPP
jgi:hypothetical protein